MSARWSPLPLPARRSWPALLTLLACVHDAGAQAAIDPPRLFPNAVHVPGRVEASFDTTTSTYHLRLRNLAGLTVVDYQVPLQHVHLQNGVLRIEEGVSGIVPMTGGGLTFRTTPVPAEGPGRMISAMDLAFSALHAPLHTGQLLFHGLDPSTQTVILRFRDEYSAPGGVVRTGKTYHLRLFGRALRIQAVADETQRLDATYNHAGFAFGPGAGLPLPTSVLHVPYMDFVPVIRGGQYHTTRFLDWYGSNGSETPSVVPAVNGSDFTGETASAYYRNDQGHLNAPIRETAWLCVSDRISDLFPVIDRPASEYRTSHAERAVSQNGPGNRYERATAWVQKAVGAAVHDMVQIKWDWHRWPFNLNDPDYFPPPPQAPIGTLWGSEPEWRAYSDSIADAGWSLAPYFSVDMMDPGYPNLTLQLPGSVVGSVLLTANPAYDASVCNRNAAGALKKGWDTNANLANTNLNGQGHPTDVIGGHVQASNMRAYAQRIHGPSGFKVAGAHIDAATDIPAWIHIDQMAGSNAPKTIAQALMDRDLVFRAAKDGMQGPLVGENSHWRYRAFETYASGLLDGSSRKIPIHWSPAQGPPNATNANAEVIPDFELMQVLPKASLHFGMGWEFHFTGSGYPVPEGFVDAWHTTLLSYGHAPFFSTNGDVTNNYWDWRSTLRSYHLTRGLSAAMRRDRVTEIRYEDGTGAERSLDEALSLGLDLVRPRLILRFAGGLEFKANHSTSDWVTSVRGTPFVLPMDGFAASAPDGLLCLSARNPATSARVDYAFTPGVVEMIDRRGVDQSHRGFPGNLLPIPPGVLPPSTNDTQLVVIRDLRGNQAIYSNGFHVGRVQTGPAPVLTSLRIAAEDGDELSLGRLRLGLRAMATDSAGNERDVTGIVTWTSSAPHIVTINRSGAATATGIGNSLLRASLAGTNLTATRQVRVTATPVVQAPRLEEIFSGAASSAVFVQFESDTLAPLTVLFVEDLQQATATFLLGNASDPVGKVHGFPLTNLRSGASYRVTPAAMNVFQLAALGPPLTFTAP